MPATDSADPVVGWALDLVRVPSQQTSRMEAEPEVVNFIRSAASPLLDKLAIPHRFDSMGNLVAEIDGSSSGPTVMFLSYAMTHPAARMARPFQGELVDGSDGPAIRGRGIAEQKASMAAMISAADRLLSGAPFAGRFILAICTAGETGRHNAVECLLGHLSAPPDMAILGIGTTGRMALGNKGRIDIEILIRGTACHSSTPWLGQNALLGAHAVISRLLPLAKRGEVHAELGPATLVATSIRSWPEATHTIQDEVKIVYDCRLLPGDTPEPALAEVRAKLRGINDVDIEVRPAAFQYPALIDAEGRLARLARLASADVDAQPLETFYSHGALDAGFLVHLGCEAAMWGPGDTALWHSDEEMVLVSDLIKGRDRYLSFLRHALA